MSNNTGHNAAHDDEFATDPIGGEDYDLALREAGAGIAPIALLPGAGEVALCDHAFELQSMRRAIEDLRAENDNLRAERDSAMAHYEVNAKPGAAYMDAK